MGSPKTVRHFNVSEIKSRVLNIAQTSLYQVNLTPPPNLLKFLEFSGRNLNLFAIENIELLCSEASLPGSSLATHDVTNDYHGVTEKMAYRRIYDDTLDLTFYVDRNYNVIEFFDGWINYIAGEGSREYSGLSRADFKSPHVNNRVIYPDTYKADVYLTKFEKDRYAAGTVMNYTFVQAFPISIVSMPISYEQSQLLKCTVSFSYIRYVRERKFISIPSSISNPNAPGNPELNNTEDESNRPTLARLAERYPSLTYDQGAAALEGGEIINAINSLNEPITRSVPQ